MIFEGERRFDLVVRLDSAHRSNIEDIKNLYINTPNGAQIPLKEVANISYEPGPMQISRDNTNRRTYVGINVRGRDIKSLVEEIQQKLKAELDLPAGYYIRYRKPGAGEQPVAGGGAHCFGPDIYPYLFCPAFFQTNGHDICSDPIGGYRWRVFPLAQRYAIQYFGRNRLYCAFWCGGA